MIQRREQHDDDTYEQKNGNTEERTFFSVLCKLEENITERVKLTSSDLRIDRMPLKSRHPYLGEGVECSSYHATLLAALIICKGK